MTGVAVIPAAAPSTISALAANSSPGSGISFAGISTIRLVPSAIRRGLHGRRGDRRAAPAWSPASRRGDRLRRTEDRASGDEEIQEDGHGPEVAARRDLLDDGSLAEVDRLAGHLVDRSGHHEAAPWRRRLLGDAGLAGRLADDVELGDERVQHQAP